MKTELAAVKISPSSGDQYSTQQPSTMTIQNSHVASRTRICNLDDDCRSTQDLDEVARVTLAKLGRELNALLRSRKLRE